MEDNYYEIAQHELDAIAATLLPDIITFFESEEGQREFAEWKAQKAIESDTK